MSRSCVFPVKSLSVLRHDVLDSEVQKYDWLEQLKIIVNGFCIAFEALISIIGFQSRISVVAQVEGEKWGMAILTPNSQTRKPMILTSMPASFFSMTTWAPGFIQCSPTIGRFIACFKRIPDFLWHGDQHSPRNGGNLTQID